MEQLGLYYILSWCLTGDSIITQLLSTYLSQLKESYISIISWLCNNFLSSALSNNTWLGIFYTVSHSQDKSQSVHNSYL